MEKNEKEEKKKIKQFSNVEEERNGSVNFSIPKFMFKMRYNFFKSFFFQRFTFISVAQLDCMFGIQ